MSATSGPAHAWSSIKQDERPNPDQPQPLRIPEVVFGLVLLFGWLPPGLPAYIPLSALATAALLLVAFLRNAPHTMGRLSWLGPAVMLLFGYLCIISAVTPDNSLFGWEKRAVRLLATLLLLLALIQGRLDMRSLLGGMVSGLLINAVAFGVGFAPAHYGGALSGYLLDKNQAGLAYAAIGVLGLALAKTRTQLYLGILIGSALVYWTGSRTGMTGYAFGVAWYLLRPHLNTLFRFGLLGAGYVLVNYIEENFSQVGEFASRAGSDWFRARIDAASQVKMDLTPWTGSGLGEAWVNIDGEKFLFHNSYWAIYVEGGVLYLGAVILIYTLPALGLFRAGRPPTHLARAAEASVVPILICATRLGEVFGATTATVVLAAALIGSLQWNQRVADPP